MHRIYEIIREFECCGKHMVIVKLQCSTHVMTMDEWKSVKRNLYYPKEKSDNRAGQKIKYSTRKKIA